MTKDICEMYQCTRWKMFLWIVKSGRFKQLLTKTGRVRLEVELILMKCETRH